MNKEIEELLDKLKDKDWYDELDLTGTRWIELKQEETKLLLSYIEQLENNRDKAYEFVKEKRKVFEWYDTDLFYLESLLKGDSE